MDDDTISELHNLSAELEKRITTLERALIELLKFTNPSERQTHDEIDTAMWDARKIMIEFDE